ncbi:MAG: hypothetical protein J6I73_06785 [Treponema sp.]|nr:hypothetical protein [Treponema sp.]
MEISFQVIQHYDAVNEVCEQTLVIEDAILDYFFNSGSIVTNEPAVAADKDEDEKIWRTSFAYAVEGGAQYFIQLCLDYDAAAKSNAIALSNIRRISWTITDVKANKKIASDKSTVRKSKTGRNDIDGVKEYASAIAADMHKMLVKKER